MKWTRVSPRGRDLRLEAAATLFGRGLCGQGTCHDGDHLLDVEEFFDGTVYFFERKRLEAAKGELRRLYQRPLRARAQNQNMK